MRGQYRLKLIRRWIEDKVRLRRALSAVKSFPTQQQKKPHGLEHPLVITLTSYPPRFPHLAKTLRSLLDQSLVVDRVELWIANEEFSELPEDVRALEEFGLSIRPCRDIRSYKKLIPALEADDDCFYVTADDDVYYPPDWLLGLVETAKLFPGTVIGGRVHRASRRPDGKLKPYSDWELATDKQAIEGDRDLLFPTGVGGILYPPGCFDDRVLAEELFMQLCPSGDDIWFFWMTRMAGTSHRRSTKWFDIVEWPSSQDVALYSDNMLSDGNDRQIRAMEAHFGPVPAVRSKQEAADQ